MNIAVTGVAGDITVSVAAERFWTETFPLGPTVDPKGLSPSQLLAARHQVVPFDPRREGILADLGRWCDGSGGLRVRLVHGPGGQGKTRLAAEFAARRNRAGWVVARARHCSDVKPGTEPLDGARAAAGLLVVIDYAERWPLEDLLALLAHRLVRQGVPTRVVLLARPAGWWWQSLLHPLAELDAAGDDTPLGNLAGDLTDRRAVFNAARDRFAEVLGIDDPAAISPPGPLADAVFGRVLTLHMAALVAVDAHAHGLASPTEPAHLAAYLLNREYAHWDRMRANGRIRTDAQSLSRVVFTATLTRPVPHSDGMAILRAVELASTLESAQTLLDDHGRCYPPAEAGSSLEPLYPDRLGEDFLATQLPDPDAAHRPPGTADPWTPDALARLLAPDAHGTLPAYAGRTAAVLVETARRWPHVAAYLDRVLRNQPTLAPFSARGDDVDRGGRGHADARSGPRPLREMGSAFLKGSVVVWRGRPPGPAVRTTMHRFQHGFSGSERITTCL